MNMYLYKVVWPVTGSKSRTSKSSKARQTRVVHPACRRTASAIQNTSIDDTITNDARFDESFQSGIRGISSTIQTEPEMFFHDTPLDLSSQEPKNNVSVILQKNNKELQIINDLDRMEVEFETAQTKLKAKQNLLDQCSKIFNNCTNIQKDLQKSYKNSGEITNSSFSPRLKAYKYTTDGNLLSSGSVQGTTYPVLPNFNNFLPRNCNQVKGFSTPPPTPRFPEQMRIELQQECLWQQFHQRGTEMIITKVGR